jgi:hypothetical protein
MSVSWCTRHGKYKRPKENWTTTLRTLCQKHNIWITIALPKDERLLFLRCKFHTILFQRNIDFIVSEKLIIYIVEKKETYDQIAEF